MQHLSLPYQCDLIGLNFSKIEETHLGIKFPVVFASKGRMTYYNTDGTSRQEDVPYDTLTDKEYLSTIEGSAVTLLHPQEAVSPSNVKKHVVGTVTVAYGNDEKQYIEGMVSLFEQGAINAVKSQITPDISMGYHKKIKATADPKIFTQVKRYHNHIALVPSGRDSKAHIQYDSKDWVSLDEKNKARNKELTEKPRKQALTPLIYCYQIKKVLY